MLRGIIGGIPFVYLGIVAIVEKKWCLWSYSPYCFEFGGLSNVIGVFFILFGILWFWSEIRRRRREKERQDQLMDNDGGE